MKDKTLLVVAVLALSIIAVSAFVFAQSPSNFNRYGMMGNMMRSGGGMMGLNSGFAGCPMMSRSFSGISSQDAQTISGTVSEIGTYDVGVESGGTTSDIHMPPFVIQYLGIKKGDSISATGINTYMMGEKEFIPFQLAINGKVYGNATENIPVWMQ